MNRGGWVLGLLGLLMSFSCAFKDKDAASAGAGIGSGPPALAITVSWQEGEQDGSDDRRSTRSDKRQLRKTPDQLFWTWDSPLQLPPEVPDALELRLDLNVGLERLRGLTVEDIVIEGRRGRGDSGGGYDERFRPLRRGSGLEIVDARASEGVSSAKVKLGDLRALFPTHEQGVLEVRISVRDASGNWLARYQGRLRTPPSLLSFRQQQLVDFEAGGRLLAPAIKRFKGEAMQIELLQILEVKNGADDAVEMDYPNRPVDASLATRVETFTYVDQGCSHEIAHADELVSLTDAIYLVALKNLDAETAFIDESPNARTVRTLRLEPGETAWLGVYGTGAKIAGIVDNGRPKQELVETQVQGRCYWHCRHRRASDWWNRHENAHKPHYVECMACEAGDLDACSSCKANDPWPVVRPWNYCDGPWQQLRQSLQVELGTRTHPVTMLISDVANRLRLRWPETADAREMGWPYPAVRYAE